VRKNLDTTATEDSGGVADHFLNKRSTPIRMAGRQLAAPCHRHKRLAPFNLGHTVSLPGCGLWGLSRQDVIEAQGHNLRCQGQIIEVESFVGTMGIGL